MRNLLAQSAATAVLVSVLGLSMIQPAYAAIISTDRAIAIEQRHTTIDQISQVLARDNVQNMLVGLGVDPEDAIERINRLTDEELQILEKDLGKLPAGGTGAVEVIGIVAIVLIILELLNVTNFFTAF